MRILVAEDDGALREGLVGLLSQAGHAPEACSDGESCVARALAGAADLVLLDVGLPGLDGFAACRALREAGCSVPVVMLTALGSEDDVVRGLDAGADDFITKPFGRRALLARIEAVGRRALGSSATAERIVADGCTLDLGLLRAARDGRQVTLSAREADIIRFLRDRRGRAVSRAELLEGVWNVPRTLRTRAVDMAVATLRAKIEADPASPRLIVSAKGRGYAWGAP